MKFTFECPTCQHSFDFSHEDLATNPKSLKCCMCGQTPSPDILTAYQNVGKTITDLYGCCECNTDKKQWLPKKINK